MSDLPHGLAPALRYAEPLPWWPWALAALALALLALLWWVQWRRSRPPAALPVPPPVPAGAPPIERLIEEIRRRWRRSRQVRGGLHELAGVLRQHFDATTGAPFSTWTAREMAGAVGEVPATRFFALLSDLQFSRRSPTRRDLDGACALALEGVRAAPPRPVRGGGRQR